MSWSKPGVRSTFEMTDEWMVALAEHFDVEPWADKVPRENWVRIQPDEITGRWIHRLDRDEPDRV